ncbi:MAG: penicillin-binding transpeptidase domain-containing protein [Tepidisphaeraceae bacterium]
MFERRLKIVLALLLLVTGVMLTRAVQLQVFGRDHWQQQAVESMKRPRLIETTRGRILDARGEPIALDVACIDAAVDYRAILEPPDPTWLNAQAIARVRRDLADSYWKVTPEERKRRIDDEAKAVKHDIGQMWKALALELDKSDPAAALERIETTRRGIVERVQMRRRYVWYHKYRQAVDEKKGETAPWYSRWLLEDQGEGLDVDNFVEDVGEQEAPHTILHNIDNDTLIRLKKSRDKYPGLAFIDSTQRYYPFHNVASHVLGRLSKVMQEDIARDPNLGRNELREYQKNDLIGRMGLEALCEPALRGTRGQVVRVAGENREMSRVESVPGADVRTTIDIKLQRDVEQLFKSVQMRTHHDNRDIIEAAEMHGAAVVIDVASGAVLTLASWPNFDANRFDEEYATLSKDFYNQPLMNRATQWAIEPGSTVKPIIGLGAIADGLCGTTHGVECTGYLTMGRVTFRHSFRCWTASQFGKSRPELVSHHQIPTNAPHRGHSGNPDGFLSFSDAVERSCNVYYETLAGKLTISGVRKWFDAFGLGRRTGIGIAEVNGRIPSGEGLSRSTLSGETWFAGIGQGQVGATAIQMANVAATLARDGVWLRPHLVSSNTPTTRPASVGVDGPDRVDLRLPPDALAAARQGMINVVYSNGGTADDMVKEARAKLAGKTGSATAAPFRTPARDERGDVIYETVEIKDTSGEVVRTIKRVKEWVSYTPLSPQNPDGILKWYRGFGEDGMTISHAWFIGYAPADNPKVAFAVMVEYGGSGGLAAGSVAKGVVDACVDHGYLVQTNFPNPKVAAAR